MAAMATVGSEHPNSLRWQAWGSPVVQGPPTMAMLKPPEFWSSLGPSSRWSHLVPGIQPQLSRATMGISMMNDA